MPRLVVATEPMSGSAVCGRCPSSQPVVSADDAGAASSPADGSGACLFPRRSYGSGGASTILHSAGMSHGLDRRWRLGGRTDAYPSNCGDREDRVSTSADHDLVEVARDRLAAVGTCSSHSSRRRGSDHPSTPERPSLRDGLRVQRCQCGSRASTWAPHGGRSTYRPADPSSSPSRS